MKECHSGERSRIVDCMLGMQSPGSRIRHRRSLGVHFQPQDRLAFAFRFEWTANRNRTDCKALTSGLGAKFSGKILPLQLTDVSMLSALKLYRGFESTSLRHSVWVAEKPGCIPRKTARKRRNFAIPGPKPDWRGVLLNSHRRTLGAFSLEGRNAVRFRRVRLANAMRSQTRHLARAT
jgi:hypothetical protein